LHELTEVPVGPEVRLQILHGVNLYGDDTTNGNAAGAARCILCGGGAWSSFSTSAVRPSPINSSPFRNCLR
jgi:hypothetical protein